jgi:hypothetical protein
MTEAEWLAATDPQGMLSFLRSTGCVTDRKLRLFAAACCRRIWHGLTDERSRQAVEVAERLADGTATEEERAAARQAAFHDVARVMPRRDGAFWAAMAASQAVLGKHQERSWWSRAAEAAESAAFAVPALAWKDPEDYVGGGLGYRQVIRHGSRRPRWLADEFFQECGAQAALLRDIIGNPFCPPPTIAPSLRDWNSGLVPRLAQAAYDDRLMPSGHLDQARLAVVCDAILDAGLPADDQIFKHLRGDGPHVRGCHVLDAILGRG